MVESKFGFFQVQVKRVLGDAIKLGQASFRVTPERFDAVDMLLPVGKLILTVVHPKVLVKTDVDQSVVAAPPIRMDHRARLDMSSDNALQRGFGAIRHDLGINPFLGASADRTRWSCHRHRVHVCHARDVRQSKTHRLLLHLATATPVRTTRRCENESSGKCC